MGQYYSVKEEMGQYYSIRWKRNLIMRFREATKDEREERRRRRRRRILLFRCAHTYYSSKNIHRRDDDARSLRVFLSGVLLRALSSLSFSRSHCIVYRGAVLALGGAFFLVVGTIRGGIFSRSKEVSEHFLQPARGFRTCLRV